MEMLGRISLPKWLFLCLLLGAAALGWGSDSFWGGANQVGIVFTIFGTIFTVVTFVYVGRISSLLKKKIRVPEVHSVLEALLPAIREGIKNWEALEGLEDPEEAKKHLEYKHEAITLIYKAKGHVQSIRPSLEVLQKECADELLALMSEDKTLFRRAPDLNPARAWRVQRELNRFSVLLDSYAKDNEAARV
ncbi:hypothetical protein ABIA54_001848 [Pseudomonas sp. EB276 TE3739]|jgi:hypothetical protein|uniref:hypothetical protein n=1 Tax=Pseudomonas TaxID=286 RepID=UPI00209C914C|nr:hypothetical protein [Pseudomonas koreensis]MCP1474065.1 hypothetical protein [Pseudomonas koreensis]